MEITNRAEARATFMAWLTEQGLEVPERIVVDYIPEYRNRSGMLGLCVSDAYFEIRTYLPSGFYEVSLDGRVTRRS